MLCSIFSPQKSLNEALHFHKQFSNALSITIMKVHTKIHAMNGYIFVEPF